MSFPNEFIRGISRNDFISTEGYLTKAVFQFDKYDESRGDDFCELSINWLDDEEAIELLLNQMNTKKGKVQFQGGYCKIQLGMFKVMFKEYLKQNHLDYERRPINEDLSKGITENPYHGNILMKQGLSNTAITNIQSSMATLAGLAIRRNDNVPKDMNLIYEAGGVGHIDI